MDYKFTYELKTVASLKKWLLSKIGKDVDIEVIKASSKIHILWAKNNTLHREVIDYSFIYTIPDHELDRLVTSLQGSLNAP